MIHLGFFFGCNHVILQTARGLAHLCRMSSQRLRPTMTTRIALIHALSHSVAPVNDAMQALWPEAVRMNLLDDSLSADLARSVNGLDRVMEDRFLALAGYAMATGAQGLLFTCSAFGTCIDAVAQRYPHLPVFKPNEAMVKDAAATGLPVGLIASFQPTLDSMPQEFPAGVLMGVELAGGALDALNRGEHDVHDESVVQAALRLKARGAQVIALAQFSMARSKPLVMERTGLPVLTTVDSAVLALRLSLTA